MDNKKDFQNLIDKDKYQVFLFSCGAYFPFNFARHPWFVINKKGMISRFEVAHYENNPESGYMFFNSYPPFLGIGVFHFSKMFLQKARLEGFIEGDENSKAFESINFIEKSQENYPYMHRYFLTGPNSNTYVQWILDKFPEFNIKLPWNFIGKNYKKD